VNLLPSRLSPTVPVTMPYKKGKSGLAGMCMHRESYGEHPYVPVELFAPFSAAQGASRLRVRASQTSIATWKGTRTSALRIGRRCLEHLAETCVRGATATNQLRSWLIPMADARKRRVAHGRADETGPGRGCATAPSGSLGVPMYVVPESQALRSLRVGG
jgi:hypothetical protein